MPRGRDQLLLGRQQTRIVRGLLPRLLGDVLAVSLGLVVYHALTGHGIARQIVFALCYVIIAAIIDATHVRAEWNLVEEFVLALKVAIVALALTATVGFLTSERVSRILFVSVTAVLILVRPLAAFGLHRLESTDRSLRTLVLVCSESEYMEMVEAIAARSLGRLRLVAWLPTDIVRPEGWHSERDHYVGDARNLERVCEQLRPWRVVIGSTEVAAEGFTESVAAVNEMGIQVRSFSTVFEEEFGRVPLVSLDVSWFLFDIGPLHRLGYRTARRAVDVAAGLLAGFVFLVLMPLVALVIRMETAGPVFYRQTRSGQSGRQFQLVKFRTMQVDAESSGPQFANAGDPRVTRVGRVLRKSRIDELPQSRSLLRGDMSLIGPRPERPEFVGGFAESLPFYNKRLLMKPGLTGWAQVHEGYSASLEDTRRKLERDLYYLKHQSLGLDIRIMAATVSSIVRLEGR